MSPACGAILELSPSHNYLTSDKLASALTGLIEMCYALYRSNNITELLHVTKSMKVICIAAISLSVIGCSDSGGEAVEPHQQLTQKIQKAETPQVTSPSDSVNAAKDKATSAKIRSAESHIHGGATLTVVSEKNLVMVELETPLYNLLGFEYEPRSAAEKDKVSNVQGLLSRPAELITFNADSGCRFNAVSYDISLFKTTAEAPKPDDHSHAHDDDHDHKHDDNAHEHSDENHDHKDADEHDEHAGHKDVILNYTAQCSAPDKLKNITVSFFDNFPNLTDLELVYLGPSVQRSAELSAQQNSADISK